MTPDKTPVAPLQDPPPPGGADTARRVREKLAGRHLVLVGLMGAGKTSVGKRLALRLGLPFVDSDHAIEEAANMSVPEIFAKHGESEFRAGERRVIARLLGEPQQVIATGGGAYMASETRERVREKAVSIWLKAELPVLMKRVLRRGDRPLLANTDPEATMRSLMAARYPVYAEADITIVSGDQPQEAMVQVALDALDAFLTRPATEDTPLIPPPDAERNPMIRPQPAPVSVDLAGRSYDILIGRDLLAGAGEHLARLAKGHRALVVTDENVGARHLAPLLASLEQAGLPALSHVLPAGEKTKSWPFLEQLVERILAERLERNDLIIALGGGVIGDLTGFSAAIARRGMRFVQIPTSLLAQSDSSVGGKTGINSPAGKNLVGAFHQPILVLCDTATLDTLPLRELRAGYAEVVKYGLIDQPAFFEWLEAGAWRGIFAGGPEREEAVRIACASKAAIVARDEHENGDRALLNLGHTFGHALEAITAYESRRLVHGEAVAIGMAMAHRFSVQLGLCTGQDERRVAQHLELVGLPVRMQAIPEWSATVDQMIAAIRQDKKVSQGALNFILTRGIGQSFIAKGVEEAPLRDFLAAELAR